MNTIIGIICVATAFVPAVTNNTILESFSQVKLAASVAYNNELVVALVTKPIFTKSDRDSLMNQVAQMLMNEGGYTKVTVTLDSDIYSAIELNLYDYHKIIAKLKLRDNVCVIGG